MSIWKWWTLWKFFFEFNAYYASIPFLPALKVFQHRRTIIFFSSSVFYTSLICSAMLLFHHFQIFFLLVKLWSHLNKILMWTIVAFPLFQHLDLLLMLMHLQSFKQLYCLAKKIAWVNNDKLKNLKSPTEWKFYSFLRKWLSL